VEYPPSLRRRWKHPYLFLTADDVHGLKARLHTAPFRANHRLLLQQSKLDLESALHEEAELGSRHHVLGGSRGFQGLMYRMGMMYLLTGQQKYVDRALTAIELSADKRWIGRKFDPDDDANAIRFADLCVGERAQGIGIAYDWMYDGLSEEQRSVVRDIARDRVLRPYWTAAQRRGEWGCREYMNWNPVVNGGVGILSLSMIDELVEATRALMLIRWLIPRHFRRVGRDGDWDEGLMYSHYAARNALNFLIAMRNTLGTDDGLVGHYRNYGYFTEMLTWRDRRGRRRQFRFRDSSSRAAPLQVQLLHLFPDNTDYLRMYDAGGRSEAIPPSPHRRRAAAQWTPDHVLFRPDVPLTSGTVRLPRIKHFRDTGIFCHRGKRLHLCALGIDTGANHGHYDMGSFELVYDGEQLITDLNYGDVSSLLHNCLRVNGREQAFRLRGRMYGLAEDARWAAITLELPGLYGPLLKSYRRHFLVVYDTALVIVDEVEAPEPVALETPFITYHKAACDADEAVITGDACALRVVSHPAAGPQVFEPVSLESCRSRRSDERYTAALSRLQEPTAAVMWLHAMVPFARSERKRAPVVSFPEQGGPLCFALSARGRRRVVYTARRTGARTLRWTCK
jgi:hypothetical protein